MKPVKQILEENLSYHHVDGLVAKGSRLENAILEAMNFVSEFAYASGHLCGVMDEQKFWKKKIQKRMDKLGESVNPLDGEKMVALEELLDGKIVDLKERSDNIELLEKYSVWLEENGYTDTDWRTEPPFAIDEFMKQLK
jgi:hypothetical protein